MKKKLLVTASVLVIAAFGLCACGNSDSSSNDEGTGVSGSINVVSREDGSGTRDAFIELFEITDDDGNDAIADTAEVTNSTSVMLQTVAQNTQAIGYVSLGSLSDDVKAVTIDGIEASTDNVKSGEYKISRPFNICYKEDELTDLDNDFISYILSDEGQRIVDEEGYISIDSNGAYNESDQSGKITIAGSTSVAPLMNKLADAYKVLNPDVTIEIQESGSSAGIQSAMEGAVEIGMSSRDLDDDEGAVLESLQISMDGIAVIVNPQNEIEDMSSDLVQKIYKGEISDWGSALE